MGGFLIFREPVFGRLWLARVLSYLGSYITAAALTLYVAGISGPVAVSLLMLSMSLPRLLGPFAGTVSDRMDGKRLMAVCDFGEATLVGAVALFLPPLPVLLALIAAAAVLSTLFFPAGRSAVPALVSAEDLAPANALLGSALNLAITLGPLLGALAFVGIRGALLLDAITFLFSAALILTLPTLPPAPGETRDGLVYVARHPVARAVVASLLLGVAFVSVDLVALVFLARDALGAGEVGFGVLFAAHGMGMILGPLLLLRRISRTAPVGVVFLGLAVEGAATLLTGLAPFFALAVAFKILSGLGNGLENVAADTTLQRVVERPMLGRVFGVFYGGVMLAEALGAVLGGVLVEISSARVAFVIAGVATLAVTLIVWRLLPRRSGAV
jgi:MFS family permease